MQVTYFEPSIAGIPSGHVVGRRRFASSAQFMYSSRSALGGSASPPLDARGLMRRRKITIADPQHLHVSLGRSLNAGCADVCVPGVHDANE